MKNVKYFPFQDSIRSASLVYVADKNRGARLMLHNTSPISAQIEYK